MKKKTKWKNYVIASIIVSIGAFIIHIKDHTPPQLDQFFLWLPVSWLMVFIFMMGFKLFLGDR